MIKPEKDYIKLHFVVILSSLVPVLASQMSESGMDGLDMALWRTMIALAVLSGYLLYKKLNIRFEQRDVFALIGIGLLSATYWILLFTSAHINPTVAAVGTSTAPLWVSLLRPVLQKKKLNIYHIIISLSALFGIYVIYNSGFEHNLAFVLAIIGALFLAIGTSLNARYTTKYNHYSITFLQLIGSFVGTGIFFYIEKQHFMPVVPKLSDTVSLILIATVVSISSYALIIKILRNISAFQVSLAGNLIPVYTIVFDLLFNGEKALMTIYFYCGASIIIFCVFAIPLSNYIFGDYTPKDKKKKSTTGNSALVPRNDLGIGSKNGLIPS